VTITFDNSVTGQPSYTGTPSVTLTVGGSGNADVFLLFATGDTGTTPTNAKCGGVTGTLLGSFVQSSNAKFWVYYWTGVPAGSQAITVTLPSSSVYSMAMVAASYLGVTSIATPWSTATGASAATISQNATDYTVSFFGSANAMTATSGTSRGIVQGGGGSLVWSGRAGVIDGTGSTSITNATSGGLVSGSIRLVGSTNWTGGATGTGTGTSSSDGKVSGQGGASGSATATSSANGVRTASSTATGTGTATANADGGRTLFGSAASTATATSYAEGASGGGTVGNGTGSSSADGYRTTLSSATGTGTGTSSVDGWVAGHGTTAATGIGTSTADGHVNHIDGATGSATGTSFADGHEGEAGGASGTGIGTSFADGTFGGSARGHGIGWSKADGTVTHADGRLDITEVTSAEAFDRANAFYNENYGPPTLLDIELKDVNGYPQGVVGDYISSTGTFQRNVPGPGTVVFKGDDPMAKVAMTCKYATVPITMSTDHFKWTGRVTDCTRDTVDGVTTYTAQLIDDLSWLSKILVFPTWWSPIEFQPIKEAIYIGPAVSCIKNMISEQIFRLYGLDLVYDLINNIGQPAAMFATLLADLQNGFEPPIVVLPTNMLTDTSKWTAMVARMQPIDTVIAATLKDCGLRLKVWLWEPGDPQPSDAFELTVPTVCVDVVDETNVQGLTGTMLDGLIGTAVEFADTAFGAIITALAGTDQSLNHDTDATNPYAGILSDWLGLDSKPPWIVYEDGPYSAIKESHVGAHTPLAHTVVGGGASPTWVNDLLDLLLEALLSAILAYAGVSGVADNILDGILDNIILAFQQVEDVARRIEAGRFCWPEALTQSGGTAWTADELIALEDALWTTRGQYTFQFITRDGQPYMYGKDFEIGHAISFVIDGVIYTDYCDSFVFTDDRSNFIESLITVGDNNPQQSPWAKLSRYIQSADDVIKAVTLQAV